MAERRSPLPPFDEQSAREKVKKAQDARNSRDPEPVAQGYTVDSDWRDRHRFFKGREAYAGNRILVRLEYEWHDADGHCYRTHGNEHFEFDDDGLMRRRDMSANDIQIEERERRYR